MLPLKLLTGKFHAGDRGPIEQSALPAHIGHQPTACITADVAGTRGIALLPDQTGTG